MALYNKKLEIAIHLAGNSLIGTGHIFRQVSMINEVKCQHSISIFFCEVDSFFINEIIKNNNEFGNIKIQIYKDSKELVKLLSEKRYDIFINDILDTEKEFILELKKLGLFVVNFEDRGSGILDADIVINDMYGKEFYRKMKHMDTYKMKKIFTGNEFTCLRKDFQLFRSKSIKEVENMKKILVTFGGTDPQNYTLMILMILINMRINESFDVSIILGMGYKHKKQIIDLCKTTKIKCYSNISNMPSLMQEYDVGITSNGRTLLEFAYLGIPCISIAQNDRERSHIFAKEENGVYYLGGQGDEYFDTEYLEKCIYKFIFDSNFRIEFI